MEIKIVFEEKDGKLSLTDKRGIAKEIQDLVAREFSKVNKNMQANGYTEKEQEHLNNPFYKKVDEITEKVKMQQILKGAEKYPEPFNPASWTGEQLVNHGLQEARDLQVYLVGLAEHIERIEEENRALRCLVAEYKSTFEQLEKENGLLSGALQEVKEDRNCWKNDCKVLEKENDNLKKEMEKVKQDAADYEKQIFMLKEIVNENELKIDRLKIDSLGKRYEVLKTDE